MPVNDDAIERHLRKHGLLAEPDEPWGPLLALVPGEPRRRLLGGAKPWEFARVQAAHHSGAKPILDLVDRAEEHPHNAMRAEDFTYDASIPPTKDLVGFTWTGDVSGDRFTVVAYVGRRSPARPGTPARRLRTWRVRCDAGHESLRREVSIPATASKCTACHPAEGWAAPEAA